LWKGRWLSALGDQLSAWEVFWVWTDSKADG
jgi:hypothetical protein